MSSRHRRYQLAHLKVVVLVVFQSSCTHVELDKEEKEELYREENGEPLKLGEQVLRAEKRIPLQDNE